MKKSIKPNQEIEVRFLEVDYPALVARLKILNAKDLGEDFLKEIIFYDQDLKWQKSGKEFVRVRSTNKGIRVSYKNHAVDSVDGTEEVELEVNDLEKTVKFLERVGLRALRHQEKKRHTFKFDGVTIDFDTWPKIPTYVELEGHSESDLKKLAQKLGLNWADAVFENARKVIETRYHIPVGYMTYFTFDRFE